MISLVYVSSAVEIMTNNELRELLEISRANNQKLGITGMMLYKDGNFMQALEGPDDAVRNLYKKVSADRRHRNIFKVFEKNIETREFGEWSMALCNFNQSPEESAEGFSQFSCDPLDSRGFRDSPTTAHKLLLSFRKNVRAPSDLEI
jgi:Sensors of blue-light using FAD